MKTPILHPALTQLVVCTGKSCLKKAQLPDLSLMTETWAREYLWRACHLTVGDCLGPCEYGLNATLLTQEGFTWLSDLREDHLQDLTRWVEACKAAKNLLPLPGHLLHLQMKRFTDAADLRFERKTP